MMRKGMLEAARPGRGRKFGTGVRVLGLLVLGCSAASATALLYPGREASIETARPAPRLENVSLWAALAPAKEESKLAGTHTVAQAEAAATASTVQAQPAVRQIPLTGGVDPTPPTPPKAIHAAVQLAPAPAIQAPPASRVSNSSPSPAPGALHTANLSVKVGAPAPQAGTGVNLNTATLEELNRLSGGGLIGRAIIRGRPYTSPEDLLKKEVLSRAVYNRIKDQVAAR
jgi:DNA uptake protein ComE-like DNA-binding protein